MSGGTFYPIRNVPDESRRIQVDALHYVGALARDLNALGRIDRALCLSGFEAVFPATVSWSRWGRLTAKN
jgi:hypothetical protein